MAYGSKVELGGSQKLSGGWEESKTTRDVQNQCGAGGRARRKGFLMLDNVIMTAEEPESVLLTKGDALGEHNTQRA